MKISIIGVAVVLLTLYSVMQHCGDHVVTVFSALWTLILFLLFAIPPGHLLMQ